MRIVAGRFYGGAVPRFDRCVQPELARIRRLAPPDRRGAPASWRRATVAPLDERPK